MSVLDRNRLIFLLLFLQFNQIEAYDWGDFHKFAVVFFSLLGTFVGFGAIFTGIYFGCFKAYLERFKEEVAETHRLYHPWPAGSARWYFQQWLKTNRSSEGEKFPPMSASLSRQPPGYLVETAQPAQTNFPTYEPERIIKTPSIVIDRPSYYTPAGYFSPTKLEKIEEYRLIREESSLSQNSGGRPVETGSRSEDRIVRTTTTHHNQQSLRPSATYI